MFSDLRMDYQKVLKTKSTIRQESLWKKRKREEMDEG